MSPVVAKADAVNPRLTREWLEYAQARGLVVDPARVRSPQDKGRVENGVKFVQVSFFAGEQFAGLADAQRRGGDWCRVRAGMRVHGTTRQRPAEVFAQVEAPALLPAPEQPYRVPAWSEARVQRDFDLSTERREDVSGGRIGTAATGAVWSLTVIEDGDGSAPGSWPRLVSARCGSAAGDRRRVGAAPGSSARYGAMCGLRSASGFADLQAAGRSAADAGAAIRHGPARGGLRALGGHAGTEVGPGDRAARHATSAAALVIAGQGPGQRHAASVRAHSETVLRSFYEFHREAGPGRY